jgi:hypothetical protein
MMIGLGVIFIVTRRGSYGAFAPVEEGPLVVFIGLLCCLTGTWGLIRTIQAIRKNEEPFQHSKPPPGNDPDFT